ncbi:hypothetical protein PCC9214_02398 [Planktothrix tepida]|uniref:DUF4112 domain-containing protein n=2 Tax=Planktothrix TaxID=54304 RepID=A0A1J1LH38_9CYAN|nr:MULTISPECIES: DUF4112 domain-containing protein [Planktothrix]CAD5948500.1 hypothetical protein PCC9214_02398 [Planktothrix tepida]CAD5962304.1 hypothetical protein NO713_03280 [Planktothrix pseudagardhii]CUR31917.1 conserved hypothetical protein [Planktothrix tepida PCC 9214]
MNTNQRLATLNRIRKLSRLMDTSIRLPVIGFRIGLDPIIGLIPGFGDIIDTAFSGYLIYLAAQFKLPNSVLGWMVFNIVLEAILGTVPLVGDIFDAFYKSNIRNLNLLEEHLNNTEPELSQVEPMNSAKKEKITV